MDIEEEQELQVKGICTILKKIIPEYFWNLKKNLPIQVQEAFRTPNRLDQNRIFTWHIIKTISTENRERIFIEGYKREKTNNV
jgi:hypothetical protein